MLRAAREDPEDRAARVRYDRETVSVYIERFRSRGLELFGLLVAAGVLVECGREIVRHPKGAYDVRQAIEIVEAGAERL